MTGRTDGKENLEPLEGTVESIIYKNAENGYTVCDLDADGELVTVVGIMPYIGEGETIHAMGKWAMHPSYGRQFKIEFYEKELPQSESAMIKYLSSHAIAGIGPKTAKKIVEKFGADTFDVIENNPMWLADIPGITAKKAADASESFRRQYGIRQVMMFCRDFFGPATAVNVYKKWGSAAVDLIKSDPYVLCEQIYGISFLRADKIAASIGCENKASRLSSGIKYVLKHNAFGNGHVFVPKDKLVAVACDLLEESSENCNDALNRLAASGEIVITESDGRCSVYLKEYYDAESYTAERLIQLNDSCVRLDSGNIERFISQTEAEFNITYAPLQRRAISNTMENGVMILTGGPGTGKTTVIRAVIALFEKTGYRVALAAPTGRAAKRMSEATSCEAKTIHRLLEMKYADSELPVFMRDENNKLEEDLFIIDEASMIDIVLMSSLLKAIKNGARILLIGDSDQLPSVGAGNVLRDIIASERFNTVSLTEIFRQARESMIVTNAHIINSGEYPTLSSKDNDFFYIQRYSGAEIAATVVDLCKNRLIKKYGDISGKIQVITPSKKGEAGTASLNSLLQEALNPPSPEKNEKRNFSNIFRTGDKVMQIRNNYDIVWYRGNTEGVGVFNGDIGTIRDIDKRSEKIIIDFDDRRAEYDFAMLDEIELAYAITVHKSQGSEYPIVILPVYDYAPQLLTRNLLYTAVTRAMEMVIIVGREDVVNAMVDNNRRTKRYTALKKMLSSSRQ